MKKCIAILFVVLAACGDNGAPSVPDAAPSPDAPVAIDATQPDAAPTYGCGSNDDCDANEICTFAPQHACGHDGARGVCEPVHQRFCPALTFWVCGCNGATYNNMCKTDISDVDVAYGGPCRDLAEPTACTTSADCPLDPDGTYFQYCVDDPRDSCDPLNGDTGCGGVCVFANQTCSPTNLCLSDGAHDPTRSPNTEICVTTLGPPTSDPDSTDTGACVYTTRVSCTTQADCGAGELCLPNQICAGGASCLGACVRPGTLQPF